MRPLLARAAFTAAAFAAISLGPLAAPAHAQTVQVTTTGDSGPGSLREAIAEVNAGNADVIDMTGLTGAISLASPLPSIANAVTVFGAGTDVTIDGGSAGAVLLNAGVNVTLNDFFIDDGLTKTGAGTLQWDGQAQFYFGATSIEAGTLATTTNFFLSASSPVTLGAGTLLDLTGTQQEVGSLEGAGDVALGDFGELTLGVLDTDTTVTGSITGGDSSVVTKDGAGTWTLGGSITTELFDVRDGAVVLATENAITSESVEVDGALVLGADQTFGDLFVNAGATVDLGTSTLTLDGGSFGSVSFGTITGAGSLHITGDVQFAFFEQSTYTGGTVASGNAYVGLYTDQALDAQSALIINDNAIVEIDGLQMVGSLSGNGGELFMCDCATFTVDQDIDTTFAGNITDDGVFGGPGGAFVKTGTGRLLLTGASSHIGGTTVLGGTLAGTTFSLQGAIVNDATVEFAQTFDGTFDGDMSGSGTLVKSGTGEVELLGSNTYTGGTIVNAGTLRVGAFDALGFGTLEVNGGLLQLDEEAAVTSLTGSGGAIGIANGASLYLDQAMDTTYGGAISGDGDLEKLGAGTLTLAGAQVGVAFVSVTEGTLALASENVLSGTQMLQADTAGRVTLGADQTVGDLVVSGGTVDLGANTLTVTGGSFGGSAVFDGTIAGAGGSLQLSGTAGLLFVGSTASTYTGATVVGDDAALGLFGDDLLSAQSSLVLNANGIVEVGGAQTFSALSGNGGEILLCDCSFLTIDQDVDTTFAGDILDDPFGIGSTFIKNGAGRLLLTGMSDRIGGTTVLGGTLAGTTDSLEGAILNNAIVEFAQDADGTFMGDMSGTGTLVKSGSGALSLTMANSYTGGTTINAGVLDAAVAGALGSGTLTVNGGALNLNSSHTATALSGAGGAIALAAAESLTITQASNTVFAGSIDGGGAIVKDGDGTLTLTGVSTYSGGTTVLGGTLAGDTDSLQGAILNQSQVTFNQTGNGAFGGAITGGGSVVKTGGGTLFVTGAFRHDGGTFVLGGTLSGSSANLGGAIVNQARVEFVQGATGAFDGVITGTGSVVKTGGGTLIFNGANGYSGGTTIAAGTLLVGSNASLGAASGAVTFDGGTLAISGDFGSARDIALAGSGTFDTGAKNALLTGSISGAGSFTKTGTGFLFLTGAASHTGGTNVLGGVVVGNTSNLHGAIRNNAIVVFDQEQSAAFAGRMNGSGAMVKTGAGTLTINGTQTYTGLTDISEGGLQLNGSLAGWVAVREGATFGGSGHVGGSVFVAGTFSAGSPGSGGGGQPGAWSFGAGAHALTQPMRVDGDLLLASSAIYEAHVAEDAGIATMEVGGRAVIDGATLHLIETSDGFLSTARRETSTVLTAGEIVGGFGAVTGLDSTFDPYLLSTGSSISLLLVRNDIDFATYASTFNGSGAGAALASVQAGASGDLAFVLRELSALASDAELAQALDRLSGAAHASFAGISMIGSADVIDVLTSRFSGAGGWWTQGLGSSLSLDEDLDPGAASATTRGLVAGYDRRWARAMAGIAAGYHDSDIDASAGLDRIDGRAYRGAVYGEYRAGRVVLDGLVSAAWHRVRGSRGIRFAATLDPAFGSGLLFGGVDRTSSFDYNATEVAAVVDAGYVIDIGGFRVQPSAGAQLTRIGRDAFAETGADSLSLTAETGSASSLAGRARLSIERRFDGAARRWIAPRASVRYTRELRDRDVPFTASLAGSSFTATGFALPGSLLSAKAGLAAGFGAISFSVDYRAAVAAGQRHHLISAGFGF